MFKLFSNTISAYLEDDLNNFIKNSGLSITNMYRECPANKPLHNSWSDVIWD